MTNITEILKDAPKGLKLYSLVHGNVTLVNANTNENISYQIQVKDLYNQDIDISKNGFYFNCYKDAECVLFPSKEHKSWDEWQDVLFQKGDVIVSIDKVPVLYYEDKGSEYSVYNKYGVKLGKTLTYLFNSRYATPEEREQFFKELNDNGYTWNDNTKQMEKSLQTNTHENYRSGYERTVIKEKPFTIEDFKPFDKVLTRNNPDGTWSANYYSHKVKLGYVCVAGFTHSYCIPYNDETSKLLGTKNDCPKKYKTW